MIRFSGEIFHFESSSTPTTVIYVDRTGTLAGFFVRTDMMYNIFVIMHML